MPTAITVANEATDTECFPCFFTAATGDLGPKTVAGLTFNSNTCNLGSTLFNGLTLTAVATGFTIAGGTTSKTLTVPLDASVSGTNTGDNATNSQYSGLAASKADVGQTFYLGTTQVAINRASAALTLAGVELTPRVVTTADDATAVIDVDVTDTYELSAVANATEFSTTGTPLDGQKLMIRFKDAGVAKAIT